MKIKTFPNKQNLREFTVSKSELTKNIKGNS